MIKNVELVELNIKIANYLLSIKDNLIEHKYFCNNNYERNFDKNLHKRFSNAYNFPNYDINKFILLLQKGVYPYEKLGK